MDNKQTAQVKNEQIVNTLKDKQKNTTKINLNRLVLAEQIRNQ